MKQKTDSQQDLVTMIDRRIAALEQRRRRVYHLEGTGGYRFMCWLRYDAQLGELRRLRGDVAGLVEG